MQRGGSWVPPATPWPALSPYPHFLRPTLSRSTLSASAHAILAVKSQEGAIHLLYLQVRPGLDHDEGVGEETCGELVQLWCHNAFQDEPVRGGMFDQTIIKRPGLSFKDTTRVGGTSDNSTNLPNHLNLSVPISCSVGGSGHACDIELAKVVTFTSNHLWAKSASVGGHDPARGGAVAR